MPKSRLHVPLSSEISEAMKVAETSVEAANYLVERFIAIVKETKMMDKAGELVSKLQDFAKYVDFKLNSSAQPWSGEMGQPSGFENMQDRMGSSAIETVKTHIHENVQLDMAINDKAELLRGFSSQGEALKDPVIVDALDKIFNAWLAKNNVISKDSSLYKVDINGKILKDANGQVKADVEQVKKLMNDPEKGLANYAESKGLDMTVDNSHAYPTQSSAKPKETTPEVSTPEPDAVEPSQPKV